MFSDAECHFTESQVHSKSKDNFLLEVERNVEDKNEMKRRNIFKDNQSKFFAKDHRFKKLYGQTVDVIS